MWYSEGGSCSSRRSHVREGFEAFFASYQPMTVELNKCHCSAEDWLASNTLFYVCFCGIRNVYPGTTLASWTTLLIAFCSVKSGEATSSSTVSCWSILPRWTRQQRPMPSQRKRNRGERTHSYL